MEPTQANLQKLFNQAAGLHQSGNPAAAEPIYLQILSIAPNTPLVLLRLGAARAQMGRNIEALEPLARALQIDAKSAEGWMDYGNVLDALGRRDEALTAYGRATALKPDYVEAIYNRACTLLELGRPAEALISVDRALGLRPNFADAWDNRGGALMSLSRFAEALASYEKMLSLRPNDPVGFSKRGVALWNLGRRNEALQSFDRALTMKEDFIDGWVNLGNALRQVRRLNESLAACDRALALNPNYVPALNHRGITLWELKRLDEAVATYDKALGLQPDNVAVLNDRGVALREMKRFDEALAGYERALQIRPDFTATMYNRANVLSDLGRLEEALAGFERTLELDPHDRRALSGMADAALNLCDWPRVEKITRQLRQAADGISVSPLTMILCGFDRAFLLAATRNFVKDCVPPEMTAFPARAPVRQEKIRLAYLSSDFIRHPVAYQIAGLIENHDRTKFEVIGISFGRDDKSEIRTRLMKGFDSFHDVKDWDSRAIAELVRKLEVDIAVDLSGYTRGGRPDIFAYRPAPVQVNYLGYPGTMGADFIDYVIGDAIALPMEEQPFYAEKIVHLPDTFWVAEQGRPIAATPTRAQAGLPEKGFVFAVFNKQPKITAAMWDIWMRLLAAVPQSVLWLRDADPNVQNTLAREAKERGVDPARLIYAPPLDSVEAHLARHRLADLMLDTLPYNAHATASDALWAGLPILTCRGHSFAGRVAASLLTAIGLPELITDSLEAYEAMALRLARGPELLQSLRARLEQNRLNAPLFDSERFRHNIEAAYCAMLEAGGTNSSRERS